MDLHHFGKTETVKTGIDHDHSMYKWPPFWLNRGRWLPKLASSPCPPNIKWPPPLSSCAKTKAWTRDACTHDWLASHSIWKMSQKRYLDVVSMMPRLRSRASRPQTGNRSEQKINPVIAHFGKWLNNDGMDTPKPTNIIIKIQLKNSSNTSRRPPYLPSSKSLSFLPKLESDLCQCQLFRAVHAFTSIAFGTMLVTSTMVDTEEKLTSPVP